MTLRVQTLPQLRVHNNAGELTSLYRRRQLLSLLLYLAVERTATRDTLLLLFWPDRREDQARHALRQALYELRQELGEDWLDATSVGLVVRANVETDLLQFESALAEGRFQDALDLYGGVFAEGLHLVPTSGFENWLDLQRGRSLRLHRGARRELLRQLMVVSAHHDALQVATRWADVDPLDDEAQQRMVELLALTGQRTEALERFEAFEERLRREELEPLADLRKLVASIRAGTFAIERQGVAARPQPSPPPVTPQDSDTPANLGPDLEVIRLIGEGDAARVYLAREAHLNRLVAVKLLTPFAKADPVLLRRFEREARTAARINHPNVTPIFRIGISSEGVPYLVLPYLAGGTLADRLAGTGPFPLSEARRVIAQIAAGLSATHRIGIVHRDLQPANVLYDHDSDRVLLTDFGTAALLESDDPDKVRLTRPGDVLGTPAYCSPELLKGESITERSDVYSLGVLAFEVLTGEFPFEVNNPIELIGSHLHAAPRRVNDLRPDVDTRLTKLIGRCLNKKPEQRPYASEIATALATVN
jgi:DNA-binding SARP family transcriptional activator